MFKPSLSSSLPNRLCKTARPNPRTSNQSKISNVITNNRTVNKIQANLSSVIKASSKFSKNGINSLPPTPQMRTRLKDGAMKVGTKFSSSSKKIKSFNNLNLKRKIKSQPLFSPKLVRDGPICQTMSEASCTSITRANNRKNTHNRSIKTTTKKTTKHS